MVDDGDPGLWNAQGQVLGESVDLRDGLGYGFEARRRASVEGSQVVAGRLERDVVGPVLPEHGAGGPVGEGHPEECGELAGVGLLLPRDAAGGHAGVDLLVPPAATLPYRPRPCEREGAVGDAVGVIAGEEVAGGHGHAPGVGVLGARLVPGAREPRAVGPRLVHRVDLADLADHPLEVPGEVLVVEALEQQHLQHVVVGARRLDVLPPVVAAKGALVELVKREVGLQPVHVGSDGLLAVAGVAVVLLDPLRGEADAVPYAPYEGGGMVLVAGYDVAQQLAAPLTPDGWS